MDSETLGIPDVSEEEPHTLVGDLLSHIDTRTKSFTASLDRAIDRSEIGSRAEARINQFVKELNQATDRLRARVSEGWANSTDVAGVLRHASSIDQFMTAHPLDASAQRDWQNLRRYLDELAHMYGVTWYWSSSQYLRSRGDDQQFGPLGFIESHGGVSVTR